MRYKILNSKKQIEKEDVIKIILENRGIKTKKAIEEFLDPKLENVTIRTVGIDKNQLQKAIGRIQKAVKNKEQIVIFGDYDVDGICGTAILWETLNNLGAKVMPYIPHRVEEGYGLSTKGISNVKFQISNVKLIVTVDNGIVANKAVEFANKEGIDVIITDHHIPSKKLPSAFAIVHTTKLCGAGVAYLLAQEMENGKWKMENGKYLELVSLATIADLVPLIGGNRTLVKFGIERLRETKRIGLLELYKEAGMDQSAIGVYEIGHIIAPRLNAMGRLEYAMDSLRLLCTASRERAKILAQTLGDTNRQRQELTLETVEHAKSIVYSSSDPSADGESRSLNDISSRQARTIMQKLLFISHESYEQGIIGLVAGKLVEEFYRPTIVVSVGEKYSKASARSVSGFNIIEFIRGASELLVDAGGHPMAAGFTVETAKLKLLQKILEDKATELIDEEKLTRTLRIDCELPFSCIDTSLYEEIQKLAPFGMGNPEPTFASRKVVIEDMRVVGNRGKHMKLNFKFQISNFKFQIDAIAFGMGERASEFRIGDRVDIAYTIDENTWNGNKKLQLKIKDIC